MNNDRFNEIRTIFEAAVDHAPEDRDAFLDKACRGDDELRCEVQKLLVADDEPEAFIDHPAIARLRTLDSAGEPGQPMEGRLVGPYQILREIGRGGMGVVYLVARIDGVAICSVTLPTQYVPRV